MPTKLDPVLLELSEHASGAEQDRRVEVIVALTLAANDAVVGRLNRAGLATRSIIGDIVTGTVRTRNLAKLSRLTDVIKIESSSPFQPEATE
jgi:hypothetical protein